MKVYQVGSSWVIVCMSFIIDIWHNSSPSFFSYFIYFFISVGSDILTKLENIKGNKNELNLICDIKCKLKKLVFIYLPLMQ